MLNGCFVVYFEHTLYIRVFMKETWIYLELPLTGFQIIDSENKRFAGGNKPIGYGKWPLKTLLDEIDISSNYIRQKGSKE